jgi:hypothetical protein
LHIVVHFPQGKGVIDPFKESETQEPVDTSPGDLKARMKRQAMNQNVPFSSPLTLDAPSAISDNSCWIGRPAGAPRGSRGNR